MNLLHLFGLLIKYKLPFINRNDCSKEIKQMFSDGGSVWQKFAQTLSLNGELIGEELAADLKTMCYQCPEHNHAYSARIIKDAFGDKYDTKHMEIIGSGTISQVYKTRIVDTGKFVAIKVMHPNVKKEISEACNYYKEVKTSAIFPTRFATLCDLFFQDLKQQLEMSREFTPLRISNAQSNGSFSLITAHFP
jgi:predicted unusual protein kinase regulating ubiquinone biosynthesis (AarF/ABC1/UbiB family)